MSAPQTATEPQEPPPIPALAKLAMQALLTAIIEAVTDKGKDGTAAGRAAQLAAAYESLCQGEEARTR